MPHTAVQDLPAKRDLAGLLTAQFLKLRCRDQVSAEEEAALAGACSGARRYAAREMIVHAKIPQMQSNLLVEGIVSRQITLADGSRQIVAIHVPGDFVDLHSFLLKALEHDVEALSPVTIATFPHDNLRRITETHPHLTRLLWLSTLMDAALHREWVANVGRRRARDRVAHLICELHARLAIVGQVRGERFAMPLTQTDLGDACGLTSVHINRVLRELREDGLVEIKSGEARILDLDRLRSEAEFDPFYLIMDSTAR